MAIENPFNLTPLLYAVSRHLCFNISVLSVFIHSLNTKYIKLDFMVYFK
jgi:hypothetical protein